MYFLLLDHEQHESWEHGTRGAKRRWRGKRMLMKAQHYCSSSSLQQRIESQRRHIDVLRSAKEDAVLSAKELHKANERIRAQLSSLTEKLSSSKQLTQVTRGNVSIFVAFLLFAQDWERRSSRSFALIMLNKCGWQADPCLLRSLPLYRKVEYFPSVLTAVVLCHWMFQEGCSPSQ